MTDQRPPKYPGDKVAEPVERQGRVVPEAKAIERRAILDACPHLSWTGDEGPVSELGRMPRRWKCDGCGAIKEDA